MKYTLLFLIGLLFVFNSNAQSDNCSEATFLLTAQLNCSTSGQNITGNTDGTTTQDGVNVLGCINGEDKPGHWYRFLAEGPDIEILNAGAIAPHVMIFNDVCPPSLSDLVYCKLLDINIETNQGDNLLITGNTYLLWVGFEGDAGPYSLCLTNPTPPLNDLCEHAQVLTTDQLDCPEIPNPVIGHTTNASQQGLYFSNLDPLVELPCALDTTKDSGVWYRFTAIGSDLAIEDNLGNNPTVLLMRYEPCETDTIFAVFCEQTPIGSDFGEVGNNATVIGDEYLLYVTFQGGESEADSFELCIDNDGMCNSESPPNSWCQTIPICGLAELDGYCFKMVADNRPSEGFAGCANSLDNPNWFSFVAGSDNMTIEIQVGDCDNGTGIQVGMYQIADTDNLGPDQPFCSVSDVGLGPLLTGCATISNPQPPGTVVTFAAVVDAGGVYAVVVDGWGPDLCQIEVNVVSGTDPLNLDSLELDPPVWDDSVFPFLGDTVCTGAENVLFRLNEALGACGGTWTLDGELIDGDSPFSRFIDFPVTGNYTICVYIENSISSSDTVCIDVVASDYFPVVTEIDTSFSCDETLLINARNFLGFEQIQGIIFTLPDGQQIQTDTFNIADTGTYIITANECSDTVIINVHQAYVIVGAITLNDCYYASLEVTTQGLTNPSYLWSMGDTTPSVDSVTYGWHTVVISSDNYTCDFERSYFIDFPDSCKSTLTGIVSLQDTTICGTNAEQYLIENQKIEIQPIGIITSTNAQGQYAIDLPYGIYQVSPILESAQLQSCPAILFDTLTSDVDTVINNFNILDTSSCNLLTCVAAGFTRAGRFVDFSVDVKNHSSTTKTFELSALFDDAYTLSSIQSPGVPLLSMVGGLAKWSPVTITPGSVQRIPFSIRLKTTVQAGDLLTTEFYLDDCSPDKTFPQTVQASYDPNDKTLVNTIARPNQNILRSDSVLDYVIRFQNTGNDTVFFVQITDQLSQHLDMYSFSPGAASHDYTWRILPDRTVEFTFDPIFLPYESIDDDGSQGFVSFSIRPNQDFELEDSILNKASIFFDFNAPVITNTVNSKYKRPRYVQVTNTTVCMGDTLFDIPIITDIVLEFTTSYFDFDSVHQYNIAVIEMEVFYVDTTVVTGTVFLGETITSDTIITTSFINPINGCENFIEYDISIAVGIDNIYSDDLSVSPNPFNNNLRFNAQEAIQKIELFDMNGKLIIVEDNIYSKEANVSTQTIHAGLYFAVVTLPDKKLQVKVLKL